MFEGEQFTGNEISLSNIINHLSQSRQLIAHERVSYTPDKIMMLLEPSNLTLLKKQFLAHLNEGLDLESFLWLMSHTIPFKPEDKYDFFYSLVKLFKQIDIDGNGRLDWQEFITYIIQAVKESSGQDTNQPNAGNKKVPHQQMLKYAKAVQPRKYKPSETVKDTTTNRGTAIKKMAYYSEIDAILCLEEAKDFIRFYDPRDLKERLADRIELSHVRAKLAKLQAKDPSTTSAKNRQPESQTIDGFVLGRDTLIFCTSSRQVIFYERDPESGQFSFNGYCDINYEAQAVYYMPMHRIFLSSDREFRLHQIFKLPRRRDEPIPQSFSFKAHNDQITQVCELENPFCVVSSSMDGTVKLWDFKHKKKLLLSLTDETFESPMKAIKGIEMCYFNMIASWGFDSFVNIWCPEHSMIKPFSGRLQCSGMVLDAKAVLESTSLISIDVKNTIRVWDIRKMVCVQSLSYTGNQAGLLSLGFAFLLFNRKVSYYELSRQNQRDAESKRQLLIPLDIYLNIQEGMFFVLTPAGLRLYNAKTGNLEAVHSDMILGESGMVSHFCRQNDRKFVISGDDGSLAVVNITNGRILHQVKEPAKEGSHYNPIGGLYLFQSENFLISVSNVIETYKIQDGDYTKTKTVHLPQESESIIALDFSEQHLLFAIATESNKVMVWSFQKTKLLYYMIAASPIVQLKFLKGRNGFAVITSQAISVHSIIHLTHEFPVVGRVEYNHPQDKPDESGLTAFLETGLPLSFFASESNPDALKQSGLTSFETKLKIQQKSLLNQANRVHEYWVVGDVAGRVSFFDATSFLDFCIEKLRHSQQVHYYQFKRPEQVRLREYPLVDANATKPMTNTIHSFSAFSQSTHAHEDEVKRIAEIQHIQCICTCSIDLTVKIFNLKLELVCFLDILKATPKLWNLDFDWIGYNLQNFEKIYALSNKVEGKKPVTSQEALNKIKARFLTGLYLHEQAQKELIQKLMATIRATMASKKPKVNPNSKRQITSAFLQARERVEKRLKESFEAEMAALRPKSTQSPQQKRIFKRDESASLRKRTVSSKSMGTFQSKKTQTKAVNDNRQLIQEMGLGTQINLINRPVSQPKLATKIETPKRQRKILSCTKKNFLMNNRFAQRLSHQTQRKVQGITKLSLVRDVLLQPGANSRLLHSGSKMATERFQTNSEPNQLTHQLFQRMKLIFQ